MGAGPRWRNGRRSGLKHRGGQPRPGSNPGLGTTMAATPVWTQRLAAATMLPSGTGSSVSEGTQPGKPARGRLVLMAEQTRDVQEQQLASLRRALGHANNNLKVMHSLRQARADEQSTGDRLDAAQTAIVTLEERIGLLENDLSQAYPSSDQTFATQLVVPESLPATGPSNKSG